MCGIAGVVRPHPIGADEGVRLARSMADTLVHRGPDDFGSHSDPAQRLVLAHRRLAIVDLGPTGHQPMSSRSGRWTVVFNGEIYNHLSIRAELESGGVRFRGHSDTETLVEAIDRWGMRQALERTNGMFAIAAWDADRRRLLLARDRMGEKPLYWTRQGATFAFASELRALRVLPDIDLHIDPEAAAAMLRWSFVPRPRSIYRDVHQLDPGGLLDVGLTDGGVVVESQAWWSLADTIGRSVAARTTLSIEAAAEELEPLLADAVASRLQSDVPLGAFLSGGIDSSLVAALAQRADPTRALRTVTVAMPDLGFDESAHARAVALHLGSDHTEVHLSAAEVFDLIPQLPRIWDEPFADPSMLPTALLCRAARTQLSVCVGGDGGDELFAGYNRHAIGATMHRRVARLPGGVRRAAAAAVMWPAPATVDRLGDLASRVLPSSRRLPNLGDKVQKAGAMLGSSALTGSETGAWETLAQIWPASSLGPTGSTPGGAHMTPSHDVVEQMLLSDTAVVLPDQMLVKLDRASMAASLEVRAPLLDHRLLEWAWRQPIGVKTHGGVGKLVLRRVAGRLLPADIVGRPKMGFDPPLATWLRNELRPWAADLLAAPRSVDEGWIDGPALRRTWSEHSAGARNWDYRLWGVLMLEAWLAEHHPH